MKSLKFICFVIGMTGMFSLAVPDVMEWPETLSVAQRSGLIVFLAIVFAGLLAWLTQFQRRHVTSPRLLQAFAFCGLAVTAMVPLKALALLPPRLGDSPHAVLQLVLIALFCLVAVQTQPASDQLEGAA